MDFSSLIEGLELNNIGFSEDVIYNTKNDIGDVDNITTFSVSDFQKELKLNSQKNNKHFHNNTDRFNAYDIAHNCIRSVLFRTFKFPLKDYSDSWLPVKLRTDLGNACHTFIQSSKIFTEQEVYLRVPSLNISTKIDCLINNNVLVEIKSCNYTDYSAIIKNNLPRTKDLYQAVLYKHLLENYLNESSSQVLTSDEIKKYNLPKLKEYDIKVLQFIYVCHELISAEANTIEQDIEFSKRLKKFMNSKNNKFWFIKEIQLDLENFNIEKIENHVVDKLKELKIYYDSKKIPDLNNKYVDPKACFFCLFKEVCRQHI